MRYLLLSRLHSLCLFAALILIFGCTPNRHLDLVIDQNHYSPIRPPNRFWHPGTIIRIRNENPVVGSIVCTQTEAFGANVPIEKSGSVTSQVASDISGTFYIGAEFLNEIKADAKLSSVKQIRIDLSETELQEITETTVLNRVAFRDLTCDQLMENEKNEKQESKNGTIALIQSILKADVVYTVEFSFGVGGDLKGPVLEGLIGKLGGGLQSDGKETLKGQALFWGVRTDSSLVRFTRRNALPSSQGRSGSISSN
jgi:hypothetical protein